jgi:hypothetical protein
MEENEYLKAEQEFASSPELQRKKAGITENMEEALGQIKNMEENYLKGLKGELNKAISPFSYSSTINEDSKGNYRIISQPDGPAPLVNFDPSYIREKIRQIKSTLDDVELFTERAWDIGNEKERG